MHASRLLIETLDKWPARALISQRRPRCDFDRRGILVNFEAGKWRIMEAIAPCDFLYFPARSLRNIAAKCDRLMRYIYFLRAKE